MAASGLGSIIQGIGAGEQAQANAQAYTYKAGVALLNKQINLTNANWAVESGDIKAEESGLQAKQQIGETLATQAASGLDVTSGSAARVRDSQESVADFNQGIIRWDAAKAAWNFGAKAATDEAEANLDTMAAATSKQAGTLAEIGSFLGGAGSVASKWYQGQSQGAFSNILGS